MKTAQYSEFGNPLEVISLIDLDHKELQSNEVRIKLELSPINPADLFVIMGSYPLRPQFPVTPGSEGVGRITEVGSDVQNLKLGDIVLMPFHRGIGTWRDELIVDGKFVRSIENPNNVSLEQLAMASVNPPSALYMLKYFVNLFEDDWVIQNAANSSVGRCVIGMAKKMGLKTVNVVRREEVVDEILALGGDVVLVDGPDLKKQVSNAVGDGQVKLALDAVAGDATHRLAQCLIEYGTIVNYGAMSMKKCELGASQTIFRSISLVGFWYHKWTQTVSSDELMKFNQKSLAYVLNKDINMKVHSTFSLDNIHEAVKTALTPKINGKVLLRGNAN